MLVERPALATDELNKRQVDFINFTQVSTIKIVRNSSVSDVHKIVFTFSGDSKKVSWYFDNKDNAYQSLQNILRMVNGIGV